MAAPPEHPVLRTIRGLLVALLVAVMLGTAADLLLLEHYEDAWQVPPLVLIAIGLGVAGWMTAAASAGAVTAMRIVMVLFIAAGVLGLVLHFIGNREFQREMDPTLGGWPLFVKVMTAKAPPALAPSVMVQIGLLGLLATYRHPSVMTPDIRSDSF
jgi:hypothetical protein